MTKQSSDGNSHDKRADFIQTENVTASTRRRFLGATAGTSLASLVPISASTTVGAEEDDETVTIVHDTHFHGRFQDAEEGELNIARYYTVVQDVLEDEDNALFLGNGDDFAPSMLGLEYEGKHMVEALNYMDIDADGVGNHEYDFGADVATERFEESEFPWVVANLLDDEGEAVPGTERWITIEEGDLTIGVFGLVSETFHSLTDYPEEWEVLGYVEGSQEAVDALRDEGADIVVLASHVSTGVHYTLASEVDGLDAIVGSHSGVVLEEPAIEDGTIISEFGDEFDHVGSITLDADGDLVNWQRTDLLPEGVDPTPEVDEYDEISARNLADIEEDEYLADLTEEWTEELEDELGQTAFESEVELNATFDNYAIETNWGNLMTDAMRTVGETDDIEVDIAAQNGGGIRGDSTYGPGEIPGTAVMDTLPFPNTIEVLEVTGQQVVDYLEEEIRPLPDQDFGAQPAIQVSGVSYEWSGHEDDVWVDNVFVGGEPVDSDETYYLAHNDYTVGNSPTLSEAEVVLETGQFQGPHVLEELESEDEPVAPERENRMIRVDEAVDSAAVEEAGDGDESDEITLTVDVPDGADEVVEDSFRVAIRTGADVDAESADSDGETVDVTFDEAALVDLIEDVDEPVARLFGSYEPDQDSWDYEFDVPASDGYDNFKLKSDVSASAVLGEEPDNGDGDDESGSDEDETPGFGPAAALAGGAGGAYLYARNRSTGDGESGGERGLDGEANKTTDA
ncbi:5'-nucleotidase C-terminal domain-containing protein [Halostagnicola sp. A-GB9-2]|uniref:bifunctional metallophosphatase/5'-nucleotidase n=1 Tax=Halostagnicola sp. A-GB9-2 TaxID=3048066 RepID=UPI0024BF666A|nr:5'-nucleotidase C-terminal domain-containing protein [Halostagnicola sp. A-GB9-2]MDJ1431232.1 5'-nucleotidase C-terminal domain-containing protein [Halostagnicola sp. A-GB9-2]